VFFSIIVDIVAANASYVTQGVLRVCPVHLGSGLMTGGTDSSHFIDGQPVFTEAQDLSRITVFVHVYGPGPVTAFTAMLVAICLKRRNAHMNIIMPIIGVVFVTLKTGFRAHIFGARRHFRHLDDAGPFFQHLCTANQETHTYYGN
jgi:hypothetical protein